MQIVNSGVLEKEMDRDEKVSDISSLSAFPVGFSGIPLRTLCFPKFKQGFCRETK